MTKISKMALPEETRRRLRESIARDTRKQSAIAEDAGIRPETLTRILSGEQGPKASTFLRLAVL